jgi:hypothetical protein
MAYDYNGSEIISKLLVNSKYKGKGKIKQKQNILVKCSECENIKETNYSGHVTNRLKSPHPNYLCHKCASSYIMSTRNKKSKGMSLDEKYGEEKANIIKNKHRENAIKNKSHERLQERINLKWDERYGKEKADKMRENHRNKCHFKPKFGNDNPQWGKPSHKLSGKGTKGYYNGIFFRSLMEVSFIIKYLEPNNIKFENGEIRKYAIPYMYEGRQRNYFCDFISDNIFFEIKPKSLHSNVQNIAKWESAKIWCNKRGYQFKVFSEYDYDKLNQDDIDNLIKDGKLILI